MFGSKLIETLNKKKRKDIRDIVFEYNIPTPNTIITKYRYRNIRLRGFFNPCNAHYINNDFYFKNKQEAQKYLLADMDDYTNEKIKVNIDIAFSMLQHYFGDFILPQLRSKHLDISNIGLFGFFLLHLNKYNGWNTVKWFSLYIEKVKNKSFNFDYYPDADKAVYSPNIDLIKKITYK